MDVNTRISLTEFQQMVKNPQYKPVKSGVNMTSASDTCSFSRDIDTVVVKPENDYDTGVLITKVNNKDGHLKFSEPKPSEPYPGSGGTYGVIPSNPYHRFPGKHS